MRTDLVQFLKKNKISLVPPLFYGNPYSLRFELGGDSPNTAARVEQATDRSLVVFNTLYKADDSIVLVLEETASEATKTKGMTKLLEPFVADLKEEQLEVIEEGFDSDEEVKSFKHIVEVPVSSLRAKEFFRARIVAELPLRESEPAIFQRCFLLNYSTAVCFYIYDDRGLDVVAPRKELLQAAYEFHNDWLLDYDLKRMKSTFGA